MLKSINKSLIQNVFEISKINNYKLFCSTTATETINIKQTFNINNNNNIDINKGFINSNNNNNDNDNNIDNKNILKKKGSSIQDELDNYNKFLEIGLKYGDIKEAVKLKEFKDLPYQYQMRFLAENQFPESAKGQVENIKIRMKKQFKKDLQREISYSQVNKTKKKTNTAYQEFYAKLEKQFNDKDYEGLVKSYSHSKARVSHDCTKLAFKAFAEIYNSDTRVEFPYFELESLFKKVAFTKFPIDEVIGIIGKLGLFKVPQFYTILLNTIESYLFVYVYDIGKELKANPRYKEYYTSYNSFIFDGSGNQAKLLNSLLVSHRREEAFQVFELSKSKASGEFLYYFVCGLIKMGYIEKSKLVMSEHFHLSKDPYYILASINMLMALGQVELASKIILESGEIESMIPHETLQMLVLEMGRLKKYDALNKFKQFIQKNVDAQEYRKLYFNAYQGFPHIQNSLLQDIEKSKYQFAVHRMISSTLKQPPVQNDQDSNSIPVVYKLIQIDYKDDNLPDFIKDSKLNNNNSINSNSSNNINNNNNNNEINNNNNNNNKNNNKNNISSVYNI